MRWPALIGILLCGAAAGADMEPQSAPLPRIVEAHFREADTGALRTLRFTEEVVVHAVHQSRRPAPPWDRSHGVRHYAIGFEPRRFAAEVRIREAGGYDFHHRLALDEGGGFVASFIEGYRRELEPDAWSPHTADVFRRTPAWIILELTLSGGPRLAPVGGEPKLTRFESSAGPLVLQFDSDGKLRCTRWEEGGVRVEARFDKYRWKGGIAVPEKVTLYWRGERVNNIRVRNVAVNAPIEPLLQPPADLPLLEMPAAAGARDFSVRELADGVWFIGESVNYQLFVELEHHVVALGSVAGVGKRIEALRERIGDKPVRQAVITHHHSDHLEGVAELVEAGVVELLTVPQHAAVVREAAGGAQDVELQLVRGSKTLDGGVRSIRIIDIGPNVHSEHMLVAYLPKEKLLWSADLFVQPPERPLRAGIEPIRDLAEAIEVHGLDVELLVDPHSPRINTISELRESVKKNPNRGH